MSMGSKEFDFGIINEYIAKSMAGYTSNIRYDGSSNNSLQEITTNHVPFPSLHYCISTHSPIIPKSDSMRNYVLKNENAKYLIDGFYRSNTETSYNIITDINEIIHQKYANLFQDPIPKMDTDIVSITMPVFKRELYPIMTDPHKWLAASLQYRGNVVSKDIEWVFSKIKSNRNIEFVDWCPSGWKFSMNYHLPKPRIDNKYLMDVEDRELSFIGNNGSIIWFLCSRIIYKYNKLKQRINEELDEMNEFSEKVRNIMKDYEEAFCESYDECDTDFESDEFEDDC